jgi:hypothetical protein
MRFALRQRGIVLRLRKEPTAPGAARASGSISTSVDGLDGARSPEADDDPSFGESKDRLSASQASDPDPGDIP